MHRIRYFKINEHIVWDRIKKLDILTGSKIHEETAVGMCLKVTIKIYMRK